MKNICTESDHDDDYDDDNDDVFVIRSKKSCPNYEAVCARIDLLL